jgi:VanZ family protein
MPGEKVPDLLKAIQSFLIHVSIYFLQAVFIFLGASKFKLIPVSKSAFSVALVFILLVGGFIEVIQEFYIDKRHGELEDVIANLLGGILAIFSWRILTKK